MAPSGGCRVQESRTGWGGGRGRVRTEVDQRYGLRSASEYCVWQAKELGFFFFFSKPAKHGDGVVRLLID